MKSTIAILITAFALTSCATMTRGTTDNLVVESYPADALVELSNGYTGMTPATFEVSRKYDIQVTISKAGYEDMTVHIISKIDLAEGAAFTTGSILAGGVFGTVYDASTGAMKSLTPNPIQVTLVKKHEK